MNVRIAIPEDAKELLSIYKYYVENTTITFEYDTPTLEEFQNRIKNTLVKYPYIVAIENDKIVGYAYASAFKGRAAYDWAVETTVYLRQSCRGRGLGRMIYSALEEILKKQNILNLNACIAYASGEDEYLNNSSTIFHEHLGYRKVGHFTKCGYKFGTWYDMIWMEKMIGEHSNVPKAIVPITELCVL